MRNVALPIQSHRRVERWKRPTIASEPPVHVQAIDAHIANEPAYTSKTSFG
jgi:hypothetical protein